MVWQVISAKFAGGERRVTMCDSLLIFLEIIIFCVTF
jgi:hypothetical protein